jgi:hypothetical protein
MCAKARDDRGNGEARVIWKDCYGRMNRSSMNVHKALDVVQAYGHGDLHFLAFRCYRNVPFLARGNWYLLCYYCS